MIGPQHETIPAIADRLGGLPPWIPGAVHRPLPNFRSGREADWRGVLNHFSAGCGDVWSTLRGRGISVQGNVTRDARPEQYVSLEHTGYGSYSPAVWAFPSFELCAHPDSCQVLEEQLDTLAWLNAYTIAYEERRTGRTIPIQRSPGYQIDTPGLKCHADGAIAGSKWNPNRHTDVPWASDVPGVAWPSNPWSYVEFEERVRLYHDGEEDWLMPLVETKEELEELITVAARKALAGETEQGFAVWKSSEGDRIRGFLLGLNDGLREAGIGGAPEERGEWLAKHLVALAHGDDAEPMHRHPGPGDRSDPREPEE